MEDDKEASQVKEQGTPETKTGPNIQTPAEPSTIGFGWPKIDDPNAPVGYVDGPTTYMLNHEANEITPDGVVRRKKT